MDVVVTGFVTTPGSSALGERGTTSFDTSSTSNLYEPVAQKRAVLQLTASDRQAAMELKRLPISVDIKMMPAMIKTATSAMMRAYSTALAPLSSLSKDGMRL